MIWKLHPWGLTWNIIVEVDGRSCSFLSFLNGWFVGSMLIFQGVLWKQPILHFNDCRRKSNLAFRDVEKSNPNPFVCRCSALFFCQGCVVFFAFTPHSQVFLRLKQTYIIFRRNNDGSVKVLVVVWSIAKIPTIQTIYIYSISYVLLHGGDESIMAWQWRITFEVNFFDPFFFSKHLPLAENLQESEKKISSPGGFLKMVAFPNNHGFSY